MCCNLGQREQSKPGRSRVSRRAQHRRRRALTGDFIACDEFRSSLLKKSVDFLEFIEQRLRIVRHVLDQISEAFEDVRLNLKRLDVVRRQFEGGKRRVEVVADFVHIIQNNVAVDQRGQFLRDLAKLLRWIAAIDRNHVETEIVVRLALEQQLEKDVLTEWTRAFRSAISARYETVRK